jgi:RecA-family ATPase/DNA-binding CsgD family transcriptional regulator
MYNIHPDFLRTAQPKPTQTRHEEEPIKHNLFTLHSANKWMQLQSTQPDAQMLFGNFWHQDELCVLFADTNLGKSILAVQLGHEIGRGACIEPFANNAKPAKVLYIDFELSPRQFQSRYNERHTTHQFTDNLYRAEFNPEAQLPPGYHTFEQYINSGIESLIKHIGAQVLIIDNISCLRSTSTGSVNEALTLMKHLKMLKTKYNLSILVLAHTPKRNPANPLSRNDMQGSKMLMNFADSAFAMGESNTKTGLRYLKQIKQRTGLEKYGVENICLFTLHKQYGYLSFNFEGYAHEFQHLRRHTQNQRLTLRLQALQYQADGLTQRKIARKMNLSVSTINRLINWTHISNR